ncbi:MAG TPA: hypothetical protein VGD19_11835 [Allosphingosinicella sp.]
MSMGARAEAQPFDGIDTADQDDWSVPVEIYGRRQEEPVVDWPPPETEAVELPRPNLLAPLLIALAVLWTVGSAWWTMRNAPELTLPAVMQWMANLSGPMILLGIVWIIFGRTPRRETEGFTRSVAEMRRESEALESVLAIVNTRLEENHVRLTDEATKLMSLGDEASDRLGRVAHYLAREVNNLDRRAEALENAAANARVDIGVLLADLPRAEDQARAIAETMKEAGLTAQNQTTALENQLSGLVARGREADEVVGTAAQRLNAHLSRIESTSAMATGKIKEAAASINSAVDGSMERASQAVEAARTGIEAQGTAMLAMVEQSRAAFDRAGEDAVRNLGQRLGKLGGKIDDLAAKLAAQDAASHALINGLTTELVELDDKFATLGNTGTANTERLNGSVETVRACVRELFLELSGGHDRAADLIDRAHDMAKALAQLTEQLQGEVPAALTKVEEHAGKARTAASSIVPRVEAIRVTTDAASAKLEEAEKSIARQQETLDAMLAKLGEGVGGAQEQLKALAAAVGEADAAAGKMVGSTGPELVAALVRVRETANQAADRAREAIAAVIPQSAAALAEASGKAMSAAITDQVRQQMEEVGAVSERAVEAARKASERLTRQMLTIGETASAMEERFEEARQEREEKESENFSRRVALLIESLNSTAIDVTKILSNEVTDSAWAAYLKGDRGVFTRRAVRLLDNNESRDIFQHYESDQEFRDQVNRYIHDFEAMLRRILTDRDSSALGVTILSSDMGKLYVALAQAIERIRT